MIKAHTTSCLLLFVFIFFLENASYSEEKTDDYYIHLNSGAPIALSKSTFNTYWYPVIDVSISGLTYMHQNLYAGLGFDYSRFYIGEWIRLKSRLHILTPNILAGYNIHISKRISMLTDISLGYSWLKFNNPVTPQEYVQSFNESGFSIKPGFAARYSFKGRVSLGLSCSYKIIFQRFGNDNIDLFENREEADCTSYINTGIHFSIRL